MCYTTACFRVGSSSGVVYYCHFISPCVNDDVILVDATQVASELLSDACRDQRWEIPVKLHYSTMLLYLSLGVGTVEYLKDRFDFFDFFYLSALMLMGKKKGGGDNRDSASRSSLDGHQGNLPSVSYWSRGLLGCLSAGMLWKYSSSTFWLQRGDKRSLII